MCIWAKGHPLFQTGDKTRDEDSVLCIAEGKFSPLMRDYRLVVSDDFFKSEREPTMSNAREVRGFLNMASVKGYIVAAAKAVSSRELALYVTTDAGTWHRAEFGDHKIEQDAYTILESTNYSIQVDVMSQRFSEMGALFSSNSNGTYFHRNIEHTNRNIQGLVDFEKIQNIQGIILANAVDNWEDVAKPLSTAKKQLKSKISFDDGRTWEGLKAGKDELHLHSVTEQHNSGRIFSSPAPGLVMGIGNTGEFLSGYGEGSLFISRDAGRTWINSGLDGPQKFEFLDQGSVLVAIAEKETDIVSYSLDQGSNWQTVKLPDKPIKTYEITTIPDSTSLKCLLIGNHGDDWATFTIDFDDLHQKKCDDGDFEDWNARTDDDGKSICLMGHKQSFRRRKADAKCFIKELTKEFLPQSTPCECTDADFECDSNFVRTADGKCEVAGRIAVPDGACKKEGDSFKGSSGWRLIPGNDCKRTSGAQKDDLQERPCSEAVDSPASGDITVKVTEHAGKRFRQIYYLERDNVKSHGQDESVVVLIDRTAFKSHDHGKTWKSVEDDAEIVAIYPHSYNDDYVYFITPSRTVYYSEDRAQTIHHFKAPDVPDPEHQILGFHQDNPDWLLWIGDEDCRRGDDDCHTVAHVSKRNGLDWKPLLRSIEKCQFMYREGRNSSTDLVYCEQYEAENKHNPLQLLSSEDFFATKKVVFPDVVNFATMSEFIVVAAKTEDRKWLTLDAGIDGQTFAPAEWPSNFNVQHEQAYTVLDSTTNAVFLHVTVNGAKNQEYGTILKSNSNGTSYVLSIPYINRNTAGFVDFEKMQGLEGVAIVNQVSNHEEVDAPPHAPKKLQTKITHNDGADWALLSPPEKDYEGKSYGCAGKGIKECALHLHGYTERRDPRDTYSSPSAVGLMIGIGNVGDHLGLYNEGNTYLTADGGITWTETMKGTYMWEYGDQGSIITIVERQVPTTRVKYTTDEGKTWHDKTFSDEPMLVEKISTVPSDNSRNFLLWGQIRGKLATVNIDFTGLTNRQCDLDKTKLGTKESDYDLWHPEHPLKEVEKDCLFGHVSAYYRKKPASDCYNGPLIDRLHDIERNCSCARTDFECAYNFERQEDGSCKLAPGLQPLSPLEMCAKDPNLFEYYEPTGYRKIPISTCHGGRELEEYGESFPCPGHEEEFRKKKGISGAGLFFAIVIPFVAAGAIGYWFFRNWDGKFGAIRLGDSSGGSSFGESPWVAWPVAALAGLIAVVAATPLLVGSLWRSARSMFGGYGGRTFTTRSSFARGRGDYAVVDPDEGELLGEDSDEEAGV
jgi:hypothetical protein